MSGCELLANLHKRRGTMPPLLPYLYSEVVTLARAVLQHAGSHPSYRVQWLV
jgi:hypothetical protein